MIKKTGLIFLCCILLACNTFAEQYLIDTDFVQSMTHGNSDVAEHLEHGDFYKFQTIYEAKKPSKMPPMATPIIPKIMHQIWIGGSQLPPLYAHYLEECKILHPDWEFKLWGDEDVQKLDMKHRDLYDASRSFAAKADILRHEILYLYGGIYRDSDVKCLKPLDELVYRYDFFAVLDNAHDYSTLVAYYNPNITLPPLNNKDNSMILNGQNSSVILLPGFMGASPQHPIVADTLKYIASDFYAAWEKFDDGLINLNTSLMLILTNLYPVKTAFLKNTTLQDKAIVFPVSYALPMFQYKFPRNDDLWSRIKDTIYDVYTLNDDTFASIELPPEAIVNINQPRYEIQLPKWGTKALNKYYNSYKSKLSVLNKHRLDLAEEMSTYSQYMPFNQNDKIPQRLIFVVLNDTEKDTLNTILPEWQLLNRSFEIDIWDKARLEQQEPTLLEKTKNTTHTLEESRFLLAIELLNKKGGHYADFRAKPIQPIFELGNKYKFYGALAPLDDDHLNVEISTKLIGSEASSPILSGSLEKFYNTQIPIRESLLDISTQHGLLYRPILILPSMAFHPIPYKYGNWSKFWNILTTNKRDFYDTTNYSVLE